MKKLILALTLFVTLPATGIFAKEEKAAVEVVVKNTGGVYTYENIVTVDNVSKEEMFERAQKWVISNLKTGDNNVGSDEKNLSINNTATIVMTPEKGFNRVVTQGLINFKIRLDFRDGRYKLVFDNIVVQWLSIYGAVETQSYDQLQNNNKSSKYIRKEVNEKLQALALELEAAVKATRSESDNW